MNRPKLTIAIVNYKTREALQECLQSLVRVSDEAEIELVVVDNASSDGSVEMLTRDFPAAFVIPNCQNLGFARAINQAFAYCNSPYFAFLNPDTWIARGTLSNLLETFERDPQIAVVGAQLTAFSGDTQPSVLAGPTVFKEFWNLLPEFKAILLPKRLKRFLLNFRTHDSRGVQEAEAVSGGALVVRSESFRQADGLDDRFFLYHEEVDLCLRLRKSGWKIAFQPRAQVLHHDALASGFRAHRLPTEPVLTWRLMGKKLLFEKHGSVGQVRRYVRMASLILHLRAVCCQIIAVFAGQSGINWRKRETELSKAAKRLSMEHFPQPRPLPAEPLHS